MAKTLFRWKFVSIILVMFCDCFAQNDCCMPIKINDQTIAEYSGTYIFESKTYSFKKYKNGNYAIQVTGDQSPRTDSLVCDKNGIRWLIDNEIWLELPCSIKAQKKWVNIFKEDTMTNIVSKQDTTIATKAGKFPRCIEITTTWYLDEHDSKGTEERIVYFSNVAGIVKLIRKAEGEIWHEEELVELRRE